MATRSIFLRQREALNGAELDGTASGTRIARSTSEPRQPLGRHPTQPRTGAEPEPRLHQPQPIMGQQQLLLLVLGIVIVGLAVVVGIQAFGENQKKANSDAITNDVIRIASDAQAWSLKPLAFGGGNGSFLNVTLPKLGYTVTSAGNYTNLNGGYALSAITAGGLTITGCNGTQKNNVAAVVSGTGPNDIQTTVSNLANAAAGTLQS